jgi:hypothetical protein
MRRLRETLLGNTLMTELDISIFENLEQCAHISLGEIAQREEKAIAKGKLVVKENITAEQRQKRHDELRGRNTVDVDALPRIVTKPGQTWHK